jgi:hypothetical protein
LNAPGTYDFRGQKLAERERKRQADLDWAQWTNDIYRLMTGGPETRRIVRRFLSGTGTLPGHMVTAHTANAQQTAFNEGRQSVGKDLLNAIYEKDCTTELSLMLQEFESERTRDNGSGNPTNTKR